MSEGSTPGTSRIGGLARDLDALRRRAGLSYRELAKRAGCPTSTLNDALSGKRFPRLETVLAVAKACGADAGPWRERWLETDRERRGADEGHTAPPTDLPSDLGTFTGRDSALAQLSAYLVPSEPRAPSARIVVINGTPGVGKTALAVRLGHRIAAAFPDGQLFVDLQGFTPGSSPLTPGQALSRLLLSDGVPAAEIPAEEGDRAALFRTRLRGRRALIVLDNARTEEQVRPLLPGRPECAVVITGRHALEGLAALDDARAYALDVLTPDEAIVLLARVAGPERVRREGAAAMELAGLCAHLPLALRVVAAQIATRPGIRLAELAARLSDAGRLEVLRVAGDPRATVRVAFDLSYRALDPAAARLYRLLGHAPGPDVTPEIAAALLDCGLDAATARLMELGSAHLVEEYRPGRFRMHDLLREDAAERGLSEDSEADRARGLERVLECYADAAARATLVLDAKATRRVAAVPAIERPRAAAFALSQPADVTRWIDAEHAGLIATAHAAAEVDAPLVVALTAALYRPFHFRGYWRDLLDLRRLAAGIARRRGDRTGEALAHEDIGFTCIQAADLDGAVENALAALAIWRDLGDPVGEQACLNILGIAYRRLGRVDEAVENLEQGLAICRRCGDRRGEAGLLITLGLAHFEARRFGRAIECLEQSLARHRELGNRDGEAVALANIGWAYHESGDPERAIAFQRDSIAITSAIGHRNQQADSLCGLGEAYDALGQHKAAVECRREALAIFEDMHDPRAAEVRTRLADAR